MSLANTRIFPKSYSRLSRSVTFSSFSPAQRTNRTSHLPSLTPAPARNISPSSPLPRTIQQTPRLPIFLKPRSRRPRIEPQFHQPLRHLDRHDIPHILRDRKSTRLNSSHQIISYAAFCLKKKNIKSHHIPTTPHLAAP